MYVCACVCAVCLSFCLSVLALHLEGAGTAVTMAVSITVSACSPCTSREPSSVTLPAFQVAEHVWGQGKHV